MLLKLRAHLTARQLDTAFSTLYRVDAIEATERHVEPWVDGRLSVPSIGSMLLKLSRPTQALNQWPLSVPSIGSMLLKREEVTPSPGPTSPFSTLYRVDAIEAMTQRSKTGGRTTFSTLYRVDAIEAWPPL